MAIVIGIPIDEAYLRRMPKYENKIIMQADMADVARERPNDERKETICRKMLEGLVKEYGAEKSTKCMVYNATGADLTYVLYHDWNGHVYGGTHPFLIKNGQWGAWLHAFIPAGPFGPIIGDPGPVILSSGAAVIPGPLGPGPVILSSGAAVVYRGKSTSGMLMDWLQSWEIQESVEDDNKVYTEVRNAGYFDNADWAYYQSLLTPKKSENTYEGCSSVATITNEIPALFIGRMTTDGPVPN